MNKFFIPIISSIIIFTLTSCSTVKDRDRVGVKEAKSCVKQQQKQSTILDDFIIKACTNNGVWVAANTNTNEQYDFLNKLYVDPNAETIAFSDLNDDARNAVLSLQKKINKELLDLY